ncbi:MAG: hypothetical protein J6Y28_09715 [Acholeplasmatales bacterium]|nr:hypothetical protein [Methanobrevibacter sp.]MBP5446435.1 hypothetical protein [Acholeplasmatales bacterium]
MEIINNIIETTINSFDFVYCLIVNILTYTVIKVIDELNGNKPISVWTKRIVLLICILFTGGLYYTIGKDSELLINSAILTPVSWSWIFKPLCIKFNIDYKQLKELD